MKTSIVLADNNPQYSYGFQPSTSNAGGGWFAGLRAKIAQLAGISEWMSQLGMADNNNPPSPSGGVLTRMPRGKSVASPERRIPDDDDTISYRSISLDDCMQTNEAIDDPWDFGASFLADLDANHTWSDTLEKQHFGPLKDLLTQGGNHKGQGHEFIDINLLHPTWCDKCGDFIWGIMRQAVKCTQCNYTCHQRCRELVTLDCRSAGSSMMSGEFDGLYPKLNDGTLGTIPKDLILPSIPTTPDKTSDSDKENSKKNFANVNATNPLFSPVAKPSATLPKSFAPLPSPSSMKEFVQLPSGQTLRVKEVYTKEDTPFEWSPAYREEQLESKINDFNRNADGLPIKMNDDGTFSGHIQIHMNFCRPISIVSGERPPTIYDVSATGKSTVHSFQTITSFFLPRNTVKTINISSTMTTRQMIVTLLRKFRVADNPKKFALYECSQEASEDTCTLLRKMTRVGDDVNPLKIVLNWGSAQCGKALVLQENDTGDILWDAFEVPELDNFIRILGLEEKQYQWQIRQKYYIYRIRLDEELQRRGQTVDTQASAPPLEYAPPPPMRDYDGYGTSNSMIVSDVFHTIRNADEIRDPTYVNIDFLKNRQAMGESTQL